MWFVRNRKILYTITAVYITLALASIAFFGLRPGIEFTGGALLEVTYPEGRVSKEAVEAQLNTLPLGAYSLRPVGDVATGDEGYLLRTKELNEEQHNQVLQALSLNGTTKVVEERRNSIGPTIGRELTNKALAALVLIVLMTIIYIAVAFAKVSKPVSSWMYGLISIIALLHDIIVPAGIFAAYGHFFGAEMDVLFVTALLTILGYSVNDTIVVFDRVRENLKINQELKMQEKFEETVGKSLEQTLTRSINTSVTVLLVVLALLFFGAESTFHFALTLTAGIVAGAYSSIAPAVPLLVSYNEWQRRKGKEIVEV